MKVLNWYEKRPGCAKRPARVFFKHDEEGIIKPHRFQVIGEDAPVNVIVEGAPVFVETRREKGVGLCYTCLAGEQHIELYVEAEQGIDFADIYRGNNAFNCPVYVEVDNKPDGQLEPFRCRIGKGELCKIDKILNVRYGASMAAGIQGIPYTCLIKDRPIQLFLTSHFWIVSLVEAKGILLPDIAV